MLQYNWYGRGNHFFYLKLTCSPFSIGPGPIKYVLPPVIGAIHKGPQHDFTRYKYPAWTMRPNSSLGKPFLTPGPGNENKLKKVNPPAYTIKSRHPGKMNY